MHTDRFGWQYSSFKFIGIMIFFPFFFKDYRSYRHMFEPYLHQFNNALEKCLEIKPCQKINKNKKCN